MIQYYLSLLLFSIMVASCQPPSFATPAEIEKERLANHILRASSSRIMKETGLHPMGTIGQMRTTVQVLGLMFYSYYPLDISQGRKFLMKSVNAMMEEVNQETRIHPFLSRCPFRPRNIEIRIIVENQGENKLPDESLWGVHAAEGFLHYKIADPKTKRLIIIYKETYEEALARIIPIVIH